MVNTKKVQQGIFIEEVESSKTDTLDQNSIEPVREHDLKTFNKVVMLSHKKIENGLATITQGRTKQIVEITGGGSGRTQKKGFEFEHEYDIYSQTPLQKGKAKIIQTLHRRTALGTDSSVEDVWRG